MFLVLKKNKKQLLNHVGFALAGTEELKQVLQEAWRTYPPSSLENYLRSFMKVLIHFFSPIGHLTIYCSIYNMETFNFIIFKGIFALQNV